MVNLAFVVAGSEATGGAGIQTDLKTFQQLGVGVGTNRWPQSFLGSNDTMHVSAPMPYTPSCR